MYSLDELNEALERESLTDALYKLERFASAQGMGDLAQWAGQELNGYDGSSPEDREDTQRYRTISVEWRDIASRPIRVGPEFHFLRHVRIPSGVKELEPYQDVGAGWTVPKISAAIAQQTGVQVSHGWLNPEELKVWLRAIRFEARRRLHNAMPRNPERKGAYPAPNFGLLVMDPALAAILSRRWTEANLCYEAGAHLATVLLLGSILEGVLLAQVQQNPAKANQAKSAPTDPGGKVLPFGAWSLQSLISVAHECEWLKPQYKDFSHVVRDYRNFIHPNQERKEGITVDAGTCRVVWEVVIAALT